MISQPHNFHVHAVRFLILDINAVRPRRHFPGGKTPFFSGLATKCVLSPVLIPTPASTCIIAIYWFMRMRA